MKMETEQDSHQTFVVFDTNAYRCLVHEEDDQSALLKVQAMVKAEAQHGIMSLCNPFVIWELVSHLKLVDPAYEDCRKSLIAMVEHTRNGDPKGGVNRTADSETELARLLFKQELPVAQENAQNLSKMASHVWAHRTNFDATFQQNVIAFSAQMDRLKNEWYTQMERSISMLSSLKKSEKKFHSTLNSDMFLRVLARERICSIAAICGIEPTESEYEELVDTLIIVHRTSLSMIRANFSNWVGTPNFDIRNPKKKRANFVWDTALSFLISDKIKIENGSLLFVTNDQAILRAAQQANCLSQVCTLDCYLDKIGV